MMQLDRGEEQAMVAARAVSPESPLSTTDEGMASAEIRLAALSLQQ
jgi:hypothetical protein